MGCGSFAHRLCGSFPRRCACNPHFTAALTVSQARHRRLLWLSTFGFVLLAAGGFEVGSNVLGAKQYATAVELSVTWPAITAATP
jgi:hypothetical protein